MAIFPALRLPRTSIFCAALAASFIAPATIAATADSAKSSAESYLDALQGSWVMAGTFGGKPVRYFADGHRVLEGGFLELHILDAATPPEYEADVFIGFDPKSNDYIAHWLDRFGAAGARVVARGERNGQRLVLVFPYAEGDFRDTFDWQAASGSWTLLMESKRADGAWATFATYTLTHREQH